VLFGLAQGSIYALIALGYTLVYGILRMINFAHSEVFMTGPFSAYFVAAGLAQTGFLNRQPVLGLLLVGGFAMLVSMTIAVLVERIAYRPLRNAPRLVPLITAIGASFVIQYVFRGFFGSGISRYPDIPVLTGALELGGLRILRTQAVVILTALVLMAGLYAFVMLSKTGKAMRAVSEDKEAAALMGIDVDRIIGTTFALGGALAGAAGVLYALIFGQVQFFMGFIPGIKAFTAAVLGGIGNVPGAMLGGLFLGVFESVGPSLFLDGLGIPSPNQLKDAIALTMLVFILIFRPSGILGERLATKKA
jgi:branched-chain amino acid transport system permease protein